MPSVKLGHKSSFLFLAIAIEVAIFALVAPNFFTLANFFEIARLNAELGLLAVALTPILIAGGIDLSVGAVMGLAARGAICTSQFQSRCSSPSRWVLSAAGSTLC